MCSNFSKFAVCSLAMLSLSSHSFAFSTEARLEQRAQEPLNSNISTLTPQFFPQFNSQRVKIRYGPYTVPPMGVDNGMGDYGEEMAQIPCTECIITWMQAGLEYPNGTYANVNTGMWLHHTVMYKTARESLVCPVEGGVENFFASGNERTPIDICVNGTVQAGYYISSNASIGFILELMNMNDTPLEAVLTITFEFIPDAPADFAQVSVLWLDIGGCGNSELPAYGDSVFQYSSPSYKSNFTGLVLGVGAHIHDGGTHLVVTQNDKTICDSIAAYGQNPSYISANSTMSSMNMSGMDMSMDTIMMHISSLSFCTDVGSIAPGDELSITAYYNTSQWMPMTDMDGSLEPIMGISLMYVTDSLNVTRSGNGSANASSVAKTNAAASVLGVTTWTTTWFGALLAASFAIAGDMISFAQ